LTVGEIKYLWNVVDVDKDNQIKAEHYHDFKEVFIDPFEEFCNLLGTYTMDEGTLVECVTNDPNITLPVTEREDFFPVLFDFMK